MSNFGTDGSNLTASSISTAKLSSYDDYTAEYYLYFNIEENDFVYTTEEEIPELVLQVTGPNGETVEEIDGLKYTSSEGISGFDVTTKEGLYAINASNIISVTSTDDSLSSKIDEWIFTLNFIYLETNQNANSSKTFKSDIIIGVEEFNDFITIDDIIIKNVVDEGEIISTIEEATTYISNKKYTWGTAIDYDAGLYATIDQTGNDSYFFAGDVEDNYVEFAGYYWRIIRIDGDGNLKLIYAGETVDATGEDRQIGTSAFNERTDGTVYTGYVYSTNAFRGTTTNSTIKGVVDTWYATNIVNTEFSDSVAITLYCIDRDAYTRSGSSGAYTWTSIGETISTSTHYYGAYKRVYGDFMPSIACNGNSSDKLSLSVGLISSDEVVFASGIRTGNTSYYLVAGSTYWTLSPSYFNSSFAYVWIAGGTGNLGTYNSNGSFGVAPSISLKSSTLFSEGDGSQENPYIVAES